MSREQPLVLKTLKGTIGAHERSYTAHLEQSGWAVSFSGGSRRWPSTWRSAVALACQRIDVDTAVGASPTRSTRAGATETSGPDERSGVVGVAGSVFVSRAVGCGKVVLNQRSTP